MTRRYIPLGLMLILLFGFVLMALKVMQVGVPTPLATAQVSVAHMFHKGQPLIWKQTHLKVYSSHPLYHAMIQSTFQAWQSALAPLQRLSLEWSSSPEEADIVIRFVDKIPLPMQRDAQNRRGYIAGLSTPLQYDATHKSLDKVSIQLALLNSEGIPQSTSVLKRVMLHEWGHALGLWGHSANAYDVMAANYYKQVQSDSLQLNQGDVKTLQALYGDSSSLVSHELTLAVLKREIERNPTQMNYWKYARALRDAGNWQEAFHHYQQAVAMDSKNPDLYLEWVQATQKHGDNVSTLRLLTTALPPALSQNARLMLEKAWVQLKLNQIDEAKVSQAEAIKREASLEASLLNQALKRYLYHLND